MYTRVANSKGSGMSVTSVQPTEANLEVLLAEEYLRQRNKPKPGDPDYLCLSDLLTAIQSLVPPNPAKVLDYGCGGSPYRALFGNCTYHRADLAGGKNLDFEYGEDARLPTEAGGYDCVLSTQVLEHVVDPAGYLRECFRVLKPGGRLLLTTHGMYQDHACPGDYWRWTTFGLHRMIEMAGLKVGQLKKVTTGPRGVMFLSERELRRLNFGKAGLYGFLLSLGIRVIRGLRMRRMHEASDISFPGYRVVDASEGGHDIYIVVAALATRE
jgi:SAM-dependent methyltransferase